MACLSLVEQQDRKLEGFLLKQGEGTLGRAFKKRWFSQKGTCLYYYRNKSDTNTAGFINLAEGTNDVASSSPSLSCERDHTQHIPTVFACTRVLTIDDRDQPYSHLVSSYRGCEGQVLVPSTWLSFACAYVRSRSYLACTPWE